MEIIGLIFLAILSAYLVRRTTEFKRPKVNVAEYGQVFKAELDIPTDKPPLTYPEAPVKHPTLEKETPETALVQSEPEETPDTQETTSDIEELQPSVTEEKSKSKPQQLQMDFN